jgi:hypothetical protein
MPNDTSRLQVYGGKSFSLHKSYIENITAPEEEKNNQMAQHMYVPSMLIHMLRLTLAVRLNGMYVITS